MGKDSQAVLQVDLFDGAKFDFNKVVTPIFVVGHHFLLGSSMAKDNYGFSANFVPNNFNLVGGRIDPRGNMTARITRQLTQRLSTTVESQMSGQQNQPSQVSV